MDAVSEAKAVAPQRWLRSSRLTAVQNADQLAPKHAYHHALHTTGISCPDLHEPFGAGKSASPLPVERFYNLGEKCCIRAMRRDPLDCVWGPQPLAQVGTALKSVRLDTEYNSSIVAINLSNSPA